MTNRERQAMPNTPDTVVTDALVGKVARRLQTNDYHEVELIREGALAAFGAMNQASAPREIEIVEGDKITIADEDMNQALDTIDYCGWVEEPDGLGVPIRDTADELPLYELAAMTKALNDELTRQRISVAYWPDLTALSRAAIEATGVSTLLARIEGLELVRDEAATVMGMLEEHGPSIVPHLLDTDDNAGERLRKAIEVSHAREA